MTSFNKRKRLYRRLFEQDEKPKDAPEKDVFVSDKESKARKSMHSVDDQIDALILKYEQSSIREEDENLMEVSLVKKSLRFLFEQDEESPGEEADAGDEPVDEPTGSENVDVKKPANKQIIPDLDIDAFANRTVRLINNHDKLLDIRTATINRIKNFLDENYGDQFVTRYLDILENEYGVETEEFDAQDMEQTGDDNFAIGANPAGAGMSS
jgi:hypothetical protein